MELSVSLPMNGEAVPRSGKCYRGCHEIAGTGGAILEQLKGKVTPDCIFDTTAAC